ncbi:MAG: ATP synthase F0 subunit B [Desulfovibrio sp.]|jgi:F-type H+-transporting ATPase subunit b|nr:ATP synthase F0 subunit B [Desulfovibrio sp.]
MLDLNITLLFQLANFLIAVFVLNLILIQPVRDIIKKRNGVIDEMTGVADTFEKQAVARLADYEDALALARQDAGNARKSGREDAVLEQQKIVGEARQNARDALDEARQNARGEAEVTLAALRRQVAGLSAGLVGRLIKG